MHSNVFKVTALATILMAAGAVYAQDEGQGSPEGITVTINGRPLGFRGEGPQMVNGRVLVPMRRIFETLGAYVQWNGGDQQVTASRGRDNVELQIGNPNATVNGQPVTLDVPAQIIGGSTMVPIRFVSESLGAEVRWKEAQQMVVIFQNRGRAQPIYAPSPPAVVVPPNRPARGREMFEPNVVIPVTLDDGISSETARPGERFMCTVVTSGDNPYGFIPRGTRISGEVVNARPRMNGNPGILELEFTQMDMPDGATYPMAGRLIGLNGLARNSNGVLIARGESVRISRPEYVGVGPEGRLIVQYGATYERTEPRNVILQSGTEFGVRLTRSLTIAGHDLRH